MRTDARRVALIAMGVFAAGCSNGAGASVDGGVPADARSGAAPDDFRHSMRPVIPWWDLDHGVVTLAPATLTPCPTGWREVSSPDEPVTCEPWPETGRATCGDGEAHFPGEADCAPVGTACPGGDFAEGLPTDRPVVYVRAGATAGDGSLTAPFGTIREAIAAAPSGAVVAVAKGRYPGTLSLSTPVSIRGACAAETTITAALGDSSPAVVAVTGAGIELADLRIASSRLGIRVDGPDAELTVAGVAVEGAQYVGVTVIGGRLTARGLSVLGTRPRPMFGLGRALDIGGGATVEVSRAALDDSVEVGVSINGSGTTATFADSSITRVAETSAMRFGHGIDVGHDAHAELRRTVIEQAHEFAIAVVGATAVLEDVVARDTAPTSDPTRAELAFGLAVEGAGTVTWTRGLVERNDSGGLRVAQVGSLAHLDDIVVRDTRFTPDGRYGYAVTAQTGGRLELARAVVERAEGTGIFAYGATARLEDVLVREIGSDAARAANGIGVNAVSGAVVDATRVVVERARTGAVLAGGAGSQLTLEDCVLRESTPDPTDGTLGRGAIVQSAAMLTIRRAVVERMHELGVDSDLGGTVVLEDTVVRDTLPRACAATTCSDAPLGVAIGSYRGSSISLVRFDVARASLCGLHVAESATADAHEGEVRGCAIGACIDVGGFDFARISDSVVFTGNESNLQSPMIPVPESVTELP